MRSNQTEKKVPVVEDWHKADIVAALKKADTNMSKLSKKHNYARGTLRNALYRSYPAAEKIIADAIGLEPKEIWPSRYKL